MPIVETKVKYDRPASVGLRHFDEISVWFKLMPTKFRQIFFLRGWQYVVVFSLLPNLAILDF